MTKSFTLIILCIFLYLTVSAQNFDVRKLTLKSDVILLYDQDSIKYIDDFVNDFTTTHYAQLKAVDTVVKNTVGFKFANTKLHFLVENEDYFKIGDKGNCTLPAIIMDEVKRKYYGLIFIKKNGKNFDVVGDLINHDSRLVWKNLIEQIKTVTELEKIKNEQERYTKSIDWFLANNALPDENFIKYYKQKGILKTDTEILTSAQLAKAKILFFNGNEIFLDFVGKAYHDEVRTYYLQVLNDIANQSEYSYGDCVRFERIADMLTNNFNDDYDDINNKLNELLTNELQSYEKQPLMKQLIKVIEANTYKTGEFLNSKL